MDGLDVAYCILAFLLVCWALRLSPAAMIGVTIYVGFMVVGWGLVAAAVLWMFAQS